MTVSVNEIILIIAFGSLLIALIAFAVIIREQSKQIHDSVSSSNVAPLYTALLPLASEYARVAMAHLSAELEAKAKATPNKIDDGIARLIAVKLTELQSLRIDEDEVNPVDESSL